MTVRTLLFASYRDIAGIDEIEIELPTDATCADLVQQLRDAGGRWNTLPPMPVVAVNLEYVPLDTILRNGDEVALIPPVAGG
jgi:molybdopterin synthase catalytic subunit